MTHPTGKVVFTEDMRATMHARYSKLQDVHDSEQEVQEGKQESRRQEEDRDLEAQGYKEEALRCYLAQEEIFVLFIDNKEAEDFHLVEEVEEDCYNNVMYN